MNKEYKKEQQHVDKGTTTNLQHKLLQHLPEKLF